MEEAPQQVSFANRSLFHFSVAVEVKEKKIFGKGLSISERLLDSHSMLMRAVIQIPASCQFANLDLKDVLTSSKRHLITLKSLNRN